MYKDVKKKILAVVLCICMVIGAVEIVPRVQAASAQPDNTAQNTFIVAGTYAGDPHTYKIRVSETTFTYNGYNQIPSIESVVDNDDNMTWDASLFKLQVTGDSKKAASYEATIVTSGSARDIKLSDTIPFKIDPLSIDGIEVSPSEGAALVIDYTGNTVFPDKSQLTVKADCGNGSYLTLSEDQYDVTSSQTAVASKASCTVTLKDLNNFVYSGDAPTATQSYTVAYNLTKTDGYKAYLKNPEYDLGSTSTPVVVLEEQNNASPSVTKIEVSDQDKQGFSFKYYRLTTDANGDRVREETTSPMSRAGTYELQMSPAAGLYLSLPGGQIFAGTYIGYFTVSSLDKTSLIVWADDEDGKRIKISDASNKLRLKFRELEEGEKIEPQNIVVLDKDNNNITEYCSIRTENADRPGTATLKITPSSADTNYNDNDPLEIYYYITSEIKLISYRFDIQVQDNSNLVYDGKAHRLGNSKNDCVVVNESDEVLNQGENYDYTVSYMYYENGQWLDADDEHLASVGRKRIVITGCNTYSGQSYPKDYWIEPVNIDSSPYKEKCSVVFNPTEYYYTGEAIVPSFTFMYGDGKDRMEVGTDKNTNGQFRISIEDANGGSDAVNAGKKTLVLTMSGLNFKGTYKAEFEIKKLPDNVSVVNDYTYSGAAPDLVFKIVDASKDINYTLSRVKSDYQVVGYRKSGTNDKWDDVAPKDAGKYDVMIRIGNSNIEYGSSKDKTLTYEIKPCSLKSLDIHIQPWELVGDQQVVWNGNKTEPEIYVPDYMIKGVDYDVKYKDNDCVSTVTSASAIVYAKSNNFKDENVLHFNLVSRTLDDDDEAFGFSIDASGDITNGYKLGLKVTDENRPSSNQSLTLGTDYTVQTVECYNDAKNQWETLAENTDYTVADSSIQGLKLAGKYRVTIKGMNGYTGTLTAEKACGKDISGYFAYISNSNEWLMPYTGESQKPTSLILNDDKGNGTGIAYDQDLTKSGFTLDYERDQNVEYTVMNADVGKIYVIAVGNPTQGYYGRTKALDKKGSYYEITVPKWGSGTLEVTVTNESELVYEPFDGTDLPVVEVTFDGKQLHEGYDFEVIYDESQVRSAGDHTITVRGDHNYKLSSNTKNVTYKVRYADINDATCPPVYANYSDATDASNIKFELNYHGEDLKEGIDYKKEVVRDANGTTIFPDNINGGFYMEFKLTGKRGNYDGTRTEKVIVGVVDFSEKGIFAESEEKAEVGQFFVEWQKSGCLIEDAYLKEDKRKAVEPKFKIFYKISEKESKLLDSANYEIVGYGDNCLPGNNSGNYVWIKGVDAKGYTGERQLFFTLYTKMTDIATTTEGSFLKDGVTVTKTAWEKIYAVSKEKGLLQLAPISFDETACIDPEEYDLVWPGEFDPEDPSVGGPYTLTVVGKQIGEHYYYGSVPIKFTVVNGIENADISVGSTNSIQYQGADHPVVVTAAGVNFTVKVGADSLVLDRDYEIVGYSGNDRIGQATVILKGKGNYSGTVEHHFNVTYPIADLVVFMKDPVKGWVNRNEDSVTYSYTGSPIRPEIMLYCPLDKPADGNYLSSTALSDTLYKKDYENNTHAGTASVIIKDSPYFTDSSANAQRSVTFSIVAGNICPPSGGGTVSYTSLKYENVEHILAEYTGEYFTVEDLGITLTDKGRTLTRGVDYEVYPDGDVKNVSDPTALPKFIFVGINNYAGSKHEISFTIVAKSIKGSSDSPITADEVTMSYTDSVSEQAIIKQMNISLQTIKGSTQKLVCGTDYEIMGYYTDPYCNNSVKAGSGVYNPDRGYYIPSAQGTYYAKVNGIGNFKDNRTVIINIGQKDLTDEIRVSFVSSADSDCVIDNSGEPDCTYNGSKHKPAVVVTYGYNNILLTEERDYTVSYNDNIAAGTASVVVRMTTDGNYVGEATRTFTIKQKNIAQVDGGTIQYSSIKESYPFVAGVSQKPEIKVGDTEPLEEERQKLKETVDYTIEYKSENAALEAEDGVPECSYGGKVVVVITGIGNYTGKQEFVYYIGEDIGAAYVQVNGLNAISTTYNGLKQPVEDSSIKVKTNDPNVVLEVDGVKRYDYAYYKSNLDNRITPDEVVDAGTYYIAVTGNPRLGTYAKSSVSNSCVYTINPRSIAPSYILVSGFDSSYYYTGQAIEPKGIVVEDNDLPVTSDVNDPQRRTLTLINGVDYDISYRNHVSAGEAVIVVNGKGNYTGSREAYFTIISSDATGNNTWNGNSEGTGSITIGTTTISVADIKLGFDNSTYNCMRYTGYPVQPQVTINGMSANDFIITAQNNINPGMATLYIQGAGNNYTGQIIMYYAIKADLGTYGRVVDIADQVYTGYQITPNVTITCGGNLLNQGSDFTVTYANNINVGRATVVAYAASDSYYTGSITSGFNISNAAGGMQVTGYASSYTYSGYPITPDVVVTMNGRVLNRGTDYTVSYSNNINVGTATMIVTGLGSFSGSQTINFTIEAKNIENCMTTAVTNYQYTGSTYTPNVTITDSSTGKTLVAGTDYTITYSNNTNPGTASITVTALSKNYTGTKVIPFKITSAAVSGLRTSTIKNNSIKLAWSAQDYADGYQICNSKNQVVATTRKNSYTVKGLTSCTTYKFKVRSYVENADGTVSYGNFSTAVSAKTLLNTPTLKVKSTSKGKVTLTWTKVAKATGYEIYYSTKKNGVYTRLKTISKSSKRQYVDAGLASGEKYYYTIRAYRTANGVKTYSNYNTIKSVKVK